MKCARQVFTRRSFLKYSVAVIPTIKVFSGSLASLLISACGGSGGSTTSPPGGATPPPTTPQLPPARYRNGQRYLFQRIPAASSPARLTGGSDYEWRIHGATNTYVDMRSGWTWDNPGGDWLDANRVRQGPTEWFSFLANGASGGTAVYNYTVNVTSALQMIQAEDRWNAFILKCAVSRAIAGTHQATHPRPEIQVVYTDASTATLACLFAADLTSSTAYCLSANPNNNLPVAMEFERPTKAIQSATMALTVVAHWSGGTPLVKGYIVDPPMNTALVNSGLAAAHNALDAGLDSDAAIIGVHHYLDGATVADFVYPTSINTSGERNYDPAIYGTGPTDLTKLPHRGLGKWINAGSNFSLVNSGYTGEGFAPLAAGLGALRVSLPAVAGLGDGSTVGYGGSLGSNAKIFMPEPDFGNLKRVFVRYYLRLQTPYVTPHAKRYQVYNSPGVSAWTDMAGKTGICPAHDTSYGGVSGSSGGGYGWQMRLSWADCDAEQGGPSENAITTGLHTYDFLFNNPAGHNYGATDATKDSGFGQKGGLGSVLYPGYWYCIEMEVDLNTVTAGAPGYLADGAVRLWLDGRLAYERTGMVMRSLPLYAPSTYDTSLSVRPIRQLGHRDLWFNWFHGGKTQNSIDRVMFMTGLAWGRSYIGPMKLS